MTSCVLVFKNEYRKTSVTWLTAGISSCPLPNYRPALTGSLFFYAPCNFQLSAFLPSPPFHRYAHLIKPFLTAAPAGQYLFSPGCTRNRPQFPAWPPHWKLSEHIRKAWPRTKHWEILLTWITGDRTALCCNRQITLRY